MSINDASERNAEAVKALEKRGWTREQIALLAGRSVATVHQWAAGSGARNPVLHVVRNLSNQEIARRLSILDQLAPGVSVRVSGALPGHEFEDTVDSIPAFSTRGTCRVVHLRSHGPAELGRIVSVESMNPAKQEPETPTSETADDCFSRGVVFVVEYSDGYLNPAEHWSSSPTLADAIASAYGCADQPGAIHIRIVKYRRTSTVYDADRFFDDLRSIARNADPEAEPPSEVTR